MTFNIVGSYTLRRESENWQRKRRVNKARVQTENGDVKRTNEHLHSPDEQAVICKEKKIGIKRKARDSLDNSRQIVGESLLIGVRLW